MTPAIIIQRQIEILEETLEKIDKAKKGGFSPYVCWVISDSENSLSKNKTNREVSEYSQAAWILAAWIQTLLQGRMYLEDWIRTLGRRPEVKRFNISKNTARHYSVRVRWVKWMIRELKKELRNAG